MAGFWYVLQVILTRFPDSLDVDYNSERGVRRIQCFWLDNLELPPLR